MKSDMLLNKTAFLTSDILCLFYIRLKEENALMMYTLKSLYLHVFTQPFIHCTSHLTYSVT